MDPNSLPELPIGDIDTGDIESGDVNLTPMEDGDVMMEYGDVDEQGAPRRRKVSLQRLARKMTGGALSHSDRKAVTALRRSRPAAANRLEQIARVVKASKPNGVLYEHLSGGTVITSSIGEDRMLGATEIESFKALAYLLPPFQPTVLPFTFDVPSQTWNVDVAQVLGTIVGLAAGTPFVYAGSLIVFTASTFNQVQGLPITCLRNITGPFTGVFAPMSSTLELEPGIKKAEFLTIHANLVGGKPRFVAPQHLVTGAPDPTSRITLSGVPSNYIPTLRMLQPGDKTVSKFLQSL